MNWSCWQGMEDAIYDSVYGYSVLGTKKQTLDGWRDGVNGRY
jgi:hypothetical protein